METLQAPMSLPGITRVRKKYDRLASNSSRLSKESMLEEFGHDKLFVETLEFLFSPLITTGISEKKLKRMVINSKDPANTDSETIGIKNLDQLMHYLKENSTGRDKDLEIVAEFIKTNDLDEEDTEFINKLVSKNLKVGITSKTINKVFIGKDHDTPFVYEFSPMLAASFEKRADKITGDFYVTQKLDGIRCLAFKENNDNNETKVSLFARSGKEIIGQAKIREDIANNELIPVGTILDGELLIKDNENTPVNKMFPATQRIVRSEKSTKEDDIIFWVFDALPTEEFKTGISKKTYAERREFLEKCFVSDENVLDDTQSDSITESNVKALPVLYSGRDKAKITEQADKADAAGFEGVMINSAEGYYRNKRTDDLQKVKSFKTADLVCVEILEGRGRHTGTLGAVVVEYKDNLVQVGSGFDDAERDYYYANPESIVGNVIEVKYFEETTDQTTLKPSLRFPVFVGVRDDKTIDDVNID